MSRKNTNCLLSAKYFFQWPGNGLIMRNLEYAIDQTVLSCLTGRLSNAL